jgi:hypothetical protein
MLFWATILIWNSFCICSCSCLFLFGVPGCICFWVPLG